MDGNYWKILGALWNYNNEPSKIGGFFDIGHTAGTPINGMM